MCFCRAGRCAKQKQPSLWFLGFCSRGPCNALYPGATLQAALSTCCKAGLLVLLWATGFGVARRLIGSSISSCPMAQSASVRLGSATETVTDRGPPLEPHSNTEAEQAGFKLAGMETCGGVRLILQGGFPFQLSISHFARGFPLLFCPASDVFLLSESDFVL